MVIYLFKLYLVVVAVVVIVVFCILTFEAEFIVWEEPETCFSLFNTATVNPVDVESLFIKFYKSVISIKV